MKQSNFSLPIYPDLTPEYINSTFIPFLKKYKDNIFDLYFTVRMSPFEQDAMGTIFSEDDIISMISNALIIHQETGIQISPVFNNKFISPNYNNYQLFIKNFKILYNAGIRSVTIPFTSWLMFGGIQKEFPELFLKNTILWSLDKPREVYDAFVNGFDYINLDRNLIRNHNQLEEIHKARKKAEEITGKKKYLSLLFNESCIGNCPIQDEHFLYNVNNNISTQSDTFFKSEMNKISCYQWEKKDKAYALKKANIPLDEEFINSLQMIDVFKLHGRESKNVFENSLDIIKFVNGDIELIDDFEEMKLKYKISDKKYNEWLNTTKNCNFDCWNCSICDDLILNNE